MTAFIAKTEATAVVAAPPEDIWAVLVDPDLVARFTPFVRSIRADGDHWIWEMSGLEVLGVGFSAVFTERMVLDEPRRIDFHHDPELPSKERAGVEGFYDLSPVSGGTRLATGLEICTDLPLPKLSGPAVRSAMKGVMATMGARFSKNLLEHLNTTAV